VHKFFQEISRYNHRHALKVGITGWAQVNGWRGDTSIEKRIEYDLYYLQNWSFGLDLRIIARTVVSALVSKNAYCIPIFPAVPSNRYLTNQAR
jgi:lipopolysaccharide/colanic/teichoic acid biosynthesis glycosyltransferase